MKWTDYAVALVVVALLLVAMFAPIISLHGRINACFEQRGLFDGEICYLERVKP